MNAIWMTKLTALAVFLLGVAGCSRDDGSARAPAEQATQSSGAGPETWIDQVLISSATPGDGASAAGLTAGQPILISMDVAAAPTGTTVTTYWYGPDNRPLAYETKTLAPNQQQLTFKEENTFDWESGDYRAEVWVGDRKVQEQSFRITG